MVNIAFRSESLRELFLSENGFFKGYTLLSRCLFAVGEIKSVGDNMLSA